MNCKLCQCKLNAADDPRKSWPLKDWRGNKIDCEFDATRHRIEDNDTCHTCIPDFVICQSCDSGIERTPLALAIPTSKLPNLAMSRPTKEQNDRWWERCLRVAFGKQFRLMKPAAVSKVLSAA